MILLCSNFSETLLNFLIGVAGSIIATFIYLKYDSYKEKTRYGKIDGFFRGISRGDDSAALVNYMSKNLLEISVSTPSGETWLGFISLYNEKNGTIEWNFQNPPERVGQFGLKKIIITDKDNFRVIGEAPDFGVETFARLNIPRQSTMESALRAVSQKL